MRRTRWLSLIGLIALLVAVTAVPAFAGPPQFDTVEVNTSQLFGSCDGFDVILSQSGVIKYSSHQIENGASVEISRYRLVDTFTNSVTGESVSSPDVGIDKTVTYTDGSSTIAVVGLYNRIVVPGQGIVTGEVGRVVFLFTGPDDDEAEVIFEAGQHMASGAFQIALCSLLAE